MEPPATPCTWHLTLHQATHGYRFALEAFLLADFVPVPALLHAVTVVSVSMLSVSGRL
jgi:hypothetical protein